MHGLWQVTWFGGEMSSPENWHHLHIRENKTGSAWSGDLLCDQPGRLSQEGALGVTYIKNLHCKSDFNFSRDICMLARFLYIIYFSHKEDLSSVE